MGGPHSDFAGRGFVAATMALSYADLSDRDRATRTAKAQVQLRTTRWTLAAYAGQECVIVTPIMPAPVNDALAFVRREWSGGQLRAIRLSELAAAAACSTGHLARQFRAHYRIGAASALEKLRLARAASMLVAGDEPLSVVAGVCGFADPYHFSRRFSATYGLPPGRYRRTAVDADVEGPLAEAGLRSMAATLWPPTAIEQVVNTSAPPWLRPGRSYGQTFTVPFGLSLTQVRFLLATYSSTTSGITVTLFRAEPVGARTRVVSRRIEPMTDNTTEWLTFPPQEHGRYLLELTDPVDTPTWWWHQGDVVDVGGSAHIDGTPVQDTNFIFAATALGPAQAGRGGAGAGAGAGVSAGPAPGSVRQGTLTDGAARRRPGVQRLRT